MTTKNQRLIKALSGGQDFTAAQITSRFGIAYPTSAITELRKEGYAIYSNTKYFSNGNAGKVYRLGTPTRRMVAAGYAMLGAYDSGLAA